jgi:hypothetical protein
MIAIPLSDEDIKYCKRMAEERNNKNGNVQTRKKNKRLSDYAVNFQGLLGEVAFSKFMNIPLDEEINPNGGDKGYDFKIHDRTIDVKYSFRNGLIFSNNYRFKADIGILTKPFDPKNTAIGVKIIGWISKQSFKEKSIIQDFGYGKCNFVPQNRLRKIETLKGVLEDLESWEN